MTSFPRIYPIILSGGSGTRLWPVSRKSSPKQFARLLGDDSPFQAAARRTAGDPFEPPVILTGEAYRFMVVEQLAAIGIPATAILIEPEPRNTAPAVLAAALSLKDCASDDLMLVMPSDHHIPDEAAFRAAIASAVPRAVAGDLVTFGVFPTRPETGYGYLELAPCADRDPMAPQTLQRFVEKPDRARAAEMIASGNYLWNAGIFLFSVKTIIDSYARLAPGMVPPVSDAVSAARPDLSFLRLGRDAWSTAESISIDYAIMEKAGNLAVMPLAASWSDLGGWASIWQEKSRDPADNSCSDNVTQIDCSGSLLLSQGDGPHLVGIGLKDMIAVSTPDAVLVAPMSESQRAGEAVAALRARGVRQAETSPRDERPWGWFESIATGDRFQVKRIFIKPGASLSLQSHNHRAEHWIIVAGTARVTISDKATLLTENQSVYVPLGARHRLENPGKLPVILIEVQTGAYLGEDDIIRYADQYARS